MVRAALLLVAVTACGRVAFEPRGDAPDAFACPPGYTFFGAGCYRSVSGGGPGVDSWFEAEASCEADGVGAHLAVPDSAAEAADIEAFAPSSVADFWIGVSDLRTEGVYLTVTNQPAEFLAWATGEPDAGRCMYMADGVVVGVSDCADGDDFVCEYDGVAAVPAAWGE